MILNFYTEQDWKTMLEDCAHSPNDILEKILLKVILLGGINLSEHSSKFLTSMWLYLQRASSETVASKHKWHVYLEGQLKKIVRDKTPYEYIETLPGNASVLRATCPKQFAAAFPMDLPVSPPAELERGIVLYDSTYKCRGGGGGQVTLSEL